MNRREFWDRCLQVYDGLNQLDDYRECMETAARELEIRPGLRVLDAGSGTGNFSMLLRTRNVDVVSLDFSPVAIRIHKQKDPEAVTVQASLEDPLPFDDASFDRIACLSVLFTISPQGARLALSEFRRILRPGGLLVLTAMMPGHSKLRGFCSHVAKRIRVAGRRNILGEFKASIFPVAKMLYYNIRMYALRRQHGYRRFTQSELIEETRRAGFADLRWRLTYGGRFLMVVGHAPQDDLWHPDAGVAARAAVHPLALSGA